MRYCSNCGQEVKEEYAFCSRCGREQKTVKVSKTKFEETNDVLHECPPMPNTMSHEEVPETGHRIFKFVKVLCALIKSMFKEYISLISSISFNNPYVRSGNSTWKKGLRFGIVFVSIIAIWFTYTAASEYIEIKKYSDVKDVTALSQIVVSDAANSKKSKAIEALLTIDRPVGLQAIEDLLSHKLPSDTEIIIWEKLIRSNAKLPSNIAVLAKGNFSHTDLIKQYFLAHLSLDEALMMIKNLMIDATKEDNGYEKITKVLQNAKSIFGLANDTDKRAFEKVSSLNASWENRDKEIQARIAELKNLNESLASSNRIIYSNLDKMHDVVMGAYYAKNVSANIYVDDMTRSIINENYNTVNQTSRAAINNISNGDVKNKAAIYMNIAKNMGVSVAREIAPLGGQVMSEADKIINYKERIGLLQEMLGEASTAQTRGLIVQTLLSETTTFIHDHKPNILYEIPVTRIFDIDMLNNGTAYTIKISDPKGGLDQYREILINNNRGSEWLFKIHGNSHPSCSVAYLRNNSKPDLVFTNKWPSGYLHILILGTSDDGVVTQLFDDMELYQDQEFKKIINNRIFLMSLINYDGYNSKELQYEVKFYKPHTREIDVDTYYLWLKWDKGQNKFKPRIVRTH